MKYSSELDMYQPVIGWFQSFLRGKIRRARVEVHDTHSSSLNKYVHQNGLQSYFDSDLWQTFDIRVDVTAFVAAPRVKGLAFVECKTKPIALRDVSQMLGYSRVAAPLYSYLLSPAGISGVVKSLILGYDRSDVLEYDWSSGQTPKRIVLGRWDPVIQALDATSVLPPGT